MSKERHIIGIDGSALPILPPDRDVRVWAKLIRVMFYTPGFLALLLIKAGEPTGFGISVELLMLASIAAVVAGLFIGSQSTEAGADCPSKIGTWSGALIIELLAVVPILCAVPGLFHELANAKLLHTMGPSSANIPLGAFELIPAVAILPFMLYQLAGFGTLHYIVTKPVNLIINFGILALIVGSTFANRQGAFGLEKATVSVLIVAMAIIVFYGVFKLREMQITYDLNCPQKAPK